MSVRKLARLIALFIALALPAFGQEAPLPTPQQTQPQQELPQQDAHPQTQQTQPQQEMPQQDAHPQMQEETPVPAPVFSFAHDIGSVAHRFPHDQWAIYTAPVHVASTPHVWRYLVPFAIGAAFIPFDRKLAANLPKGHGGVSDTIANIGLDGTAATAGIFYIMGMARHDAHQRETGLLAGESLLNSIIPHTALSFVFGRRRPFQGGGDEVGEGDFFARHSASGSFPSGHSMYTWAMASTFIDEYPNLPNRVLWYTIATTVTVSRVTGRQHFASDVIVGGAIGYLIAKKIYHRHHNAKQHW